MSASNASVPYDINLSNFVSVKLSGKSNYVLWEAQMLCLLDTINIRGILNDTFAGPSNSGTETMRQYNNLVKGWIFGTISENVLVEVFNLGSAKVVWEELRSKYGPALQEETKTQTEGRDANNTEEGANLDEITVVQDMMSRVNETLNSVNHYFSNLSDNTSHRMLRKWIESGNWSSIEPMLKQYEPLAIMPLDTNHNTMLHIAVGMGQNDFLKKLFLYISDGQVLIKRASDGMTALHVAAIVGNLYAVDLLVKRNINLLRIKDYYGEEPVQKAYANLHLDTIRYMFKALKHKGETELKSSLGSSLNSDDENVVKLLVNTISAKQYNLAAELVEMFPAAASKSDQVLMAIAKTFPSGLDLWETLIYSPSLEDILEILQAAARFSVSPFLMVISVIYDYFFITCDGIFTLLITVVFLTVPRMLVFMLALAFAIICFFLVLMVCFIFLMFYIILWISAKTLVAPVKHIKKKKKESDDASNLLKLVCNEIDKLTYSGTPHPLYKRPILEASCRNAYMFVTEILSRSPEVIESKDKDGYDIIHLAIINRSEKIYNLIHDIGERKQSYRLYKDSSENNILHLAGKLAPTSVLNQKTGAALQLQRELQWHEEVKKLVFPTLCRLHILLRRAFLVRHLIWFSQGNMRSW